MWTPLEIALDPFVHFCVGCIAAPLFANPDMTNAKMIEYFTHPAMVGSAAALVLAWLVVHLPFLGGKPVALSRSDRMLARWYLLNGVVIHALMDGMVGVFKVNKYFAAQYALVDQRYADPIGVFNGSAVHVVSLLELFVKGPVCVLLYVAIRKGWRSRDALEFFTCVTQAYGTVVYLGQEAISGGRNLDVDWDLTFTPDKLFYFWFAIIFGCVLYLIVPGIVGWRVYKRLVANSPSSVEAAAVASSSSKKAKRG
jgi:hypothetical protein